MNIYRDSYKGTNKNSLINKLEKKFGRFAIKNLTIYILIAYAVGYILYYSNFDLYNALELAPARVMQGEVWRLFTWIITIPEDISFFLIIMFFFYYWIGNTLEKYWGVFRYNVYIFSGFFFITLSCMIIYWVTGTVSLNASTYYINLTSFLAFATCFPDMQVMFMMIIPIKIKWIAIADVLYLAYEFISYQKYLSNDQVLLFAMQGIDIKEYVWSIRIQIIVSLLNFIIFFFAYRGKRGLSPQQKMRRQEYRNTVNKVYEGPKKHKCAICGRTEEDDPTLTFRFCSKCNGNYEYCNEHIFTHEHVK